MIATLISLSIAAFLGLALAVTIQRKVIKKLKRDNYYLRQQLTEHYSESS